MSFFKHDTAEVDDGAVIGQGSRIWHFTHVCAGAKIGAQVSLGQNVYVSHKVEIGDHCKIQNNVSIYDDVTLEAEVFCGPSMVFTNVVNPRAHVDRKDSYAKTLIKTGATLGANSTIVCGVTVGEFAFVGAGAVVTSNVKPFSLVVGVPATQIGWMTKHGERIDLPLAGEGHYECPKTGELYELRDDQLFSVPA